MKSKLPPAVFYKCKILLKYTAASEGFNDYIELLCLCGDV